MNEWRSIEDAPKYGVRIITYSNGLGVCISSWESQKYHKKPRPYWTNEKERCFGVDFVRKNQPTHWMPLPDPPTT